MSTRATILIKKAGEQDKFIYHHHDGYPDGVGSDLKKYLGQDNIEWNQDFLSNNITNGGVLTNKYDFYTEKRKQQPDTEYELDECIHGDEEYVYVIDCDNKTLKCYIHHFDEYENCIKPDREVEIP